MFEGIKRIFRRGRRYPIKKNEYGLSARKRAFTAFDAGKKPRDVIKHVEISIETANRYYASWKKEPVDFSSYYEVFKRELKERPALFDKLVDSLSLRYGMKRDETIARLQKPYGLKKIMKGELEKQLQLEQKRKRDKKIQRTAAFFDDLEKIGVSGTELRQALHMVLDKKAKKDEQGQP